MTKQESMTRGQLDTFLPYENMQREFSNEQDGLKIVFDSQRKNL